MAYIHMLCSFKHKKSPSVEPIDEESDEDNDSEENPDFESCNFCREEFDDIDLIDHYGTTGHNLMED